MRNIFLNKKGSVFNIRYVWFSLCAGAAAYFFVMFLAIRLLRPALSGSRQAYYLINGLSIAIGILTIAVLFLSVTLHRFIAKGYAGLKELHIFKKLYDMLQQSSSDVESLEILYNFLRSLPQVEKAVLFYCDNPESEGNTWRYLTDADMGLCGICSENCPVILNGCEFHVDNIKAGSNCCPYQLSEYASGSYVCYPVVFEGKQVKSIIQLYSSKNSALNATELFKISSYIDIGRSAINIRKAMRLLSTKADTDKLTKLYNRSFLDPYLENQIEAANLSNQQISAIMVDMDHFKSVNDTFGHIVGDYVLTVLAQLISKCIRKTDLIARFGGDEFIIILPSTGTDTAEQIAERIRREVAEAHIPPYNNIIIPPISCSVGISTYPIFCDSKDALIMTSDQALYRAKQEGRNRIKTYTGTAVIA